ncbi:MAG: TldD/PmbA family protein [Thermodesulfobacteriota bacterium]
MLEKWDCKKILKMAMKRGGEFADIYLEDKVNTSIICEENRIEKIVTGRDLGVGIRVIYGHKTAYAYSNDLSEKAVLNLADTLNKAVEEGEDRGIAAVKKANLEVMPVGIDPIGMELDDKVSLVMSGNRVARAMDKRIRQVKVAYGDSVKNFAVANSLGESIEESRTNIFIMMHIVAEENGVIQTAYDVEGGVLGFEIFGDIPPEEIAKKVAERAVLMLKARKAPGGKMPVVLSSEAGGTMIHEAIGHGLEADLAQQGLSIYSGKKGEKVASHLITVIDDATIPTRRGSFLYDDEGVPAQKTVLVENGILKGFMYDRLMAIKDGVSSTGNGRRESYHQRPIPRMTNTLIAPGESDPQSIIRSVDKGLFVKKMGGGQVNTVNGDFVFEVPEGYLIEGGKIGEPVRGATLTGNGPQVLKCIDMVGCDLGFSIGTCGKDGQGVPVSDAQPTLRIPEIVVGGEV